MKNILCYGDSNTHGFRPEDGGRYEKHVRWPGVLQKELGEEYNVIEEGLNGRTTVWVDPLGEEKCGIRYLPACLNSHKPLDLVIVMLGSNDLKERFAVPPSDIALGMEKIIDLIRTSGCFKDNEKPRILLMAPVPLGKLQSFASMFGPDAARKSRELVDCYRLLAKRRGLYFLEAGAVISASEEDGLHFTAAAHGALGKAVSQTVRDILGQE